VISKTGDQLRSRRPREKGLTQCADDTRAGAIARSRQQRVQPILRRQRRNGARRLERDTANPPPRLGAENVVGINRLVCAVESAETQMQNSD
jgi:hypothetical protein